MIIQCTSCSRKFVVKDKDIPEKGRTVQCGYCSVTWHQMPKNTEPNVDKKIIELEKDNNRTEKFKDELKASDGKTYKYLGNQWAVLLPSGKTGIFAKKKITAELNKIAGIKNKKIKKTNKISEVDPSSAGLANNRLPDIYKPREGLGYLGYIFITIIVILSLIGILKTFEIYLVSFFPKIEFIYELLDKQIHYFLETVKNMVVIAEDLINSY